LSISGPAIVSSRAPTYACGFSCASETATGRQRTRTAESQGFIGTPDDELDRGKRMGILTNQRAPGQDHRPITSSRLKDLGPREPRVAARVCRRRETGNPGTGSGPLVSPDFT